MAVFFLLLLVGSGSLAFRAFRSRVHGARYAVRLGEHGDTITTTLGGLRVSRREGKIHVLRDDRETAWIALGDVRGAQSRVASKQALLEEFLLEGGGVLDLLPEHRDRRMSWEIVLVTAHGLVPIARLSQYQVNDWFDFATPVQLWILRKLGFHRDGAEVAEEILQAVQGLLRRAGLQVMGGYEVALPTGALDGAFLPKSVRRPGPIDIPQDAPPQGPAGWPDSSGSGGPSGPPHA